MGEIKPKLTPDTNDTIKTTKQHCWTIAVCIFLLSIAILIQLFRVLLILIQCTAQVLFFSLSLKTSCKYSHFFSGSTVLFKLKYGADDRSRQNVSCHLEKSQKNRTFLHFAYFFSSFFFLSHIFCILLQLPNWRIFLLIFSTNSLFYVKIYRYFWLYFLHSEFRVDTFSLCIWISNICYSVFFETFFFLFLGFFMN